MRRSVVISLAFLLVTTCARGQFVSLGCDPSWAKWRIMESSRFSVIYPQEIDSLARRYLFLLERSSDSVRVPLENKIKKMPVVLHPYTVMSNGMVTWAPRRIEMITRPVWNGYPYNWEKQLVLHENRHVAQISKFYRGIFSPLSYVLGEQAIGIGVGLYASLWSMEGDAVVAETALSNSGRGRDPAFLMFYRTLFLNGDFRSYDRWVLGSYRDYVPNVYSLGYLVNSGIRIRTDDKRYYGKVLSKMIDHFYNFNCSSLAYREKTGMDTEDNLSYAISMYSDLWRREDSLRVTDKRSYAITAEDSSVRYEEYKYPVPIAKDSVIALRWSLGHLPALVIIDSSKSVRHLRYMGRLTSSLSYKRGKVYWTEVVPSLRWELQSFSDLFSYTLSSGKTERITRGADIYSPSHSTTGDTVAIIRYPVNGSSRLSLLDLDTGRELLSSEAPGRGQLKECVWVGSSIFCTLILDDGMKIYRFDTDSLRWMEFLSFGYKNISSISAHDKYLVFESGLDGVNNVYMCDLKSSQLYRLTNVRYGAFYPSVLSSNLYFSDYSTRGKHIERRALDMNSLVPVEREEIEYSNPIADKLSAQEGYSIDTVTVPAVLNYGSKSYNRASHLFRFHSWAPFYFNPDNIASLSKRNITEAISIGAVAFSQSTLGDAVTMMGYSYSKGFHAGHIKFSYRGLFPVFELSADFNERDRLRFNSAEVKVDTVKRSSLITSKLLSYIPFKFGRGGWSRGFLPMLEWRYSNDFGGENRVTLGALYYSMLGTAKQNLYPRYGVGAEVRYRMVFNRQFRSAPLLYANLYGYLPGISLNHGIRYSIQGQKSLISGTVAVQDGFASMPRGYRDLFFKDFYSLSLDYAMPLSLGNLSLSWLLYLKRMQIVPFVDMAVAHSLKGGVKNMASVGCDILFDFNVFRLTLPLSCGLRYARTLESHNHIQFLFRMPIF